MRLLIRKILFSDKMLLKCRILLLKKTRKIYLPKKTFFFNALITENWTMKILKTAIDLRFNGVRRRNNWKIDLPYIFWIFLLWHSHGLFVVQLRANRIQNHHKLREWFYLALYMYSVPTHLNKITIRRFYKKIPYFSYS